MLGFLVWIGNSHIGGTGGRFSVDFRPSFDGYLADSFHGFQSGLLCCVSPFPFGNFVLLFGHLLSNGSPFGLDVDVLCIVFIMG